MDRVEVCSSITDTCEWRPAREIDLGACSYKPGVIVEKKLPTVNEDSCVAGCASSGPDDCSKRCGKIHECKSWTLQQDTNACWLFSTGGLNVVEGAQGWVHGLPCSRGDQWDDIKSHLKAGDISKEDYDYLFAAFRSNPWAGFTGRRKLSEILNYRAGNATEKNLMQEEFVNLQKRVTKEEKADVYYQIQSDAEVNLAQFESVAHDPVYEPDAEDETACTANDDPSECKGGSTNSDRRKKYREMKEIFELTKTKRERLADNKQIGAGLLSVIQDRQISTRNSQTMRNKAENYIKSITATTDDEERKTLIKNMKKDFTNKREGCCYDNTNSVVIKKAKDALDRAIFLSDSDKEKFQNFIDANENDQTEEGIKEREEAKEKAAKKLDSVNQHRNRQAYNKWKDFLKRLYNGGES